MPAVTTLIVPLFVSAPVYAGTMVTPTALLPTEFEIVPLFATVLLEFSRTAGPVFDTSTEPLVVMMILPGVLFAALAVETGDVVLLLMVRSSAKAGLASSTQAAPDAAMRIFTKGLPPTYRGI